MFDNKRLLSETFLVTGKVDKVSKVNYDTIKSHILSHHKKENYLSDNPVFYKKDHFKIGYHQHIQWVSDYIRDMFNIEYKKYLHTLNKNYEDNISAIVLQPNQSLITHNHINPYDLDCSPDVSCYLNLTEDENLPKLVFEYDDHRKKELRLIQKLFKNKFVLFSSSLNHYTMSNETDKDIILLCLKYSL